jgi:hypothetical protein
METKHLLIGIVIFILIGTALYYLGSMIGGVEENMKKERAENPLLMIEALQKVEDLKIETQEAQKKQEEILNNQGF